MNNNKHKWINASEVVGRLSEPITIIRITAMLKELAGHQIVGTVKQDERVLALFHFALQQDSREAWDLLMRLYRHTAFTQAHIVLDAEDADDVAQDTMLKLWIKRATFDENTNLGGLVRVIARNAATDVIRSRRASVGGTLPLDDEDLTEEVVFIPDGETVYAEEPEEYGGDGTDGTPEDLDTPEGALEAQQTLDAMAVGFGALAKTTQGMLNMRDAGCEFDEIGERYVFDADTVRKIISRAETYLWEVATLRKY